MNHTKLVLDYQQEPRKQIELQQTLSLHFLHRQNFDRDVILTPSFCKLF